MLSAANPVFAAEFVMSAAIQVFAAELVLSEANEGFADKFMLSTGNQGFAAELCSPQRIRCSLLNSVVRSNSGVRYRIYMVARNPVFAAEFVLSVAN